MNQSSNTGSLIAGLLGVSFIVLKLCKVIDWSWWWITCPFWGSFALAIVFFIFSFLIASLSAKKTKEKLNRFPPKKSAFQAKLEQMQEQKKNLK